MTAVVEPGATFAGYRIESVVGRGGMGVVYRATDLSLARPVALKLIAPELAEDERFREPLPRGVAARRLARPPERRPDLRGAARRTGSSTSRCASSRAATSARCWTAGHARSRARARDPRPGRGRAGRRAPARPRPPRREAGQRARRRGRARVPDGLRHHQAGRPRVDGHRRRSSARSTTSRRSRSAARRSTAAPTCTRSPACSTSACRGAPPFRRETRGRDAVGAHAGGAGAAAGSPGARAGARARAGEGARRPLCELRRADRRGARRSGSAALRSAGAASRRACCAAAAGRPARRVCSCSAPGRRGDVALTGDDGAGDAPPADNGVAAIGAAEGEDRLVHARRRRPRATSRSARARSGCSTPRTRPSRGIDPETGQVADTFKTGGRPSDLAAGAGAVWVGTGGDDDGRRHVSVARVDPGPTAVTHTAALPGAGAGAAASTSATATRRSRSAPGRCGRPTPDAQRRPDRPGPAGIVAIVDIEAKTLAAGADGVWILNWDNAVTRIDPRTNRVAETIGVGEQPAQRDRRRRGRRVGDFGGGPAVAHRAGTEPDHADDRRRDGSLVRGVRRRRGVDGQLGRRDAVPGRPADERGDGEDGARRRGTGARGRRRLGVGERGGRAARRAAAGVDVRADRVGRRARPTC